MQKLIDGIHHFQQTIFETKKDLFERLAHGQQPLALFITCSDSRIDPSLLMQTQPGELFIMRIMGNIIPPYSAISTCEAATIEYAVAVLKVQDIIVCGHHLCGAMDALLHPDHLNGLDTVKDCLRHAHATAKIIEDNYGHLTDEKARLAATVEENVLVQIENLRTHPRVAAAVSRSDVKLHGWTYDFETGQVHSYDPQGGSFSPLKQVTETPQSATQRCP